jgi:hypothetical protein
VTALILKEFSSNAMRRDELKAGFFYLADMNGDGEKDVLFGMENDIYLLRGDRAFRLRRETIKSTDGAAAADNKTAVSADERRIIENKWNMLQINDNVFFVEPGHLDDIEPEARN